MGYGARRSVAIRAPRPARASANPARIGGEVQPRLRPSMSAPTSPPRNKAAASWPTGSIRRDSVEAVDSGIQRAAASSATAQSGTLNQKTARHPNAPVRRPPSSGPATRPSDPSPAQIPIARARSAGSRREALTRASDAGSSAAAPTPCTARAAISAAGTGASAQASVPPPKTASPNRNTRRRPKPSATCPALRMRLARDSA
jgi:hypothetical protein